MDSVLNYKKRQPAPLTGAEPQPQGTAGLAQGVMKRTTQQAPPPNVPAQTQPGPFQPLMGPSPSQLAMPAQQWDYAKGGDGMGGGADIMTVLRQLLGGQ